MDSKIMSLNKQILDRKTVNPFIYNPLLQDKLLDFLENFSFFEDDFVLYPHIASHALRILAQVKNKKVLAYINHYLNMADCLLPEGNTLREINPGIFDACLDALYILSGPRHLNLSFHVLYETTIDKDLAFEYFKAELMGHLKIHNDFEKRMEWNIPHTLKSEMLQAFKKHPHIISYLAIQCLDQDFYHLINNFLYQNKHHIIDNEIISYEDTLIIEAWYLFRMLQGPKPYPLKDYLHYVLNFERESHDFHLIYPREGEQKTLSINQLSKKRIHQCWEIMIEEFLHAFDLNHPQILHSNFSNEANTDNIIPLFK